MATLENIRKRGPLVAAVIGLALLAFILGDLFNSGGGFSVSSRFRIAEINGEDIDYRDFEQRIQEAIDSYQRNGQSLSEADKEYVKEMVWENMVQTALLQKEYEETGVNVSTEELFELMQGQNVDPMVFQNPSFKNPQTGMFDPALVVQAYKNIDQLRPEQRDYLLSIEKQVKDSKMMRKYFSLIQKGLYVSTPLVKTEFKNSGYLVDIDYVGKRYSEIPDSTVSISDDDLKKYYKEHKEDFEQEPSRDIVYVTFDVLPSAEDTAIALKYIKDLAPQFESDEDAEQFIKLNSDESFDPLHYKKGEIENAEIDSIMFSSEEGTVYGPYYEGGSYKLTKLLEVTDLPDSLEVKHILIAINGQSIPDATKAKLVADSLKTVIENGVDFATVAKEYSADQQTMEKGGDLGWLTESQMLGLPIKYKELVEKEQDKMFVLEESYGVHIMVKTNQGEKFKKVQIGTLESKVEYSNETHRGVYVKATRFAGENANINKFNEAITKQGLIKRQAPGLTENGTRIPGLESPRQLIKWAYTAKIGDVSEAFELGSRFVVGALVDIKKEGIAPLEQVQGQVRMAVLKEKKAEILLKQVNAALPANLDALAQKLNTEVKESKNINFSGYSVSGMGFEPNVIAKAVTSEKGKVSEAIKGESGVYVISVTSITPSMDTEKVDLEINRKNILQALHRRLYPNQQIRTNGVVIDALKEAADISDERSKFY